MKCGICNSSKIKILFEKKGKDDQIYKIIKCKQCKVVQTYPRPSIVNDLYKKEYFEKRTDRGYNQYTSEETKKILIKTWECNLKDLNFFEYEKEIFKKNQSPKLLEIGCASGFFLEYIRHRGWQVEGVEISREMSEFANQNFKVNVWNLDIMDFNPRTKYDCIVLWATIEHFVNPLAILNKICDLLNQNGVLILSTCKWGFLAKVRKQKWRFMNVPEHLYFFDQTSLTAIIENLHFKKISYITYGSGMTTKKNMNFYYKFFKTIFDFLVKKIYMGDMMVMMFKKI